MGPKQASTILPTTKTTNTTTTKKRKIPASDSGARKRARTYDARTLAVQSSDAALSKTGELDVSAFVAAREFEIRALEAGIRNSKAALASRAFQKVPRNLRRRTASHNVKRVPSRLRARAKREMIEDNTATVTARRRKPTKLLRLRLETARRLQNLNSLSKSKRAAKKAAASSQAPAPEEEEEVVEGGGHGAKKKLTHDVNIAPRVPKIKKNRLSHPEKPQSKFKKRQRCKTWLPTHMFHAKRAHMTSPKDPLWRFVVPLSPTEKSYRPTHRASGARGAVAWDMSYISTIGLEGVQASLEMLFRTLGVIGEEAWGSKGRKWRAGTRSLEVWLFEREGEKRPIAPVTLVWCVDKAAKTDGDGDVEMAEVGRKPKKPRRKMFLRVHPSAFLEVWEELLKAAKLQNPQVMIEDLRFDIGSIDITGPGATETLLAALQPIPPSDEKKWQEGSPEATWISLAGLTNASSLPQNALLAFNISDPRLRHPSRTILSPTSETCSNELAALLSSWNPDSTQLIPDIFSRPARLTASRLLPSQKAINRRKSLAKPGDYPSPKPTDPHIPVLILTSRPKSISSGGNSQQLAFECGEPWFPGDYPGTNAGWAWEIREREIRRREWERKPRQRRVAYDSIDLGGAKKGEIGQGWACDWERLVLLNAPKSEELLAKHEDSTAAAAATEEEEEEEEEELTLINRGTPTPRSRLYRLPTTNLSRRNEWLALLSPSAPTPSTQKLNKKQRQAATTHQNGSKLLPTNLSADPEPAAHLPMPDEEDLIGFVTTGNYNLAAGRGTGIASVLVDRVGGFDGPGFECLDLPSSGESGGKGPVSVVGKAVRGIKGCISKEKLARICIVRSAGERVGRLGVWEVV
ncbi:hypothetical protein ACJ72_03027 [Emergomyces africanus]|uniref:Uncharacterized protein n=1 Tax=Emergomyces africanus TaxID=1955775 RepID=A0A1B7P0S2_9EURO|nr:hypothetical protein ACJ72_03027 [Emergomyces africanus]